MFSESVTPYFNTVNWYEKINARYKLISAAEEMFFFSTKHAYSLCYFCIYISYVIGPV